MEKKIEYEEMIEKHPEFKGAIHKSSWEFIAHSDKGTVDFLYDLWAKNIRKNFKKGLWKKHGSCYQSLLKMGKNKAIIGVGAGQSFNLNKHVLKQIHDFEAGKSWEERCFIIIASNHQFKPLLEMGIIPDFVIVADGSDVVMDQLNKDVPKEGQKCVLLAGLHCDPKVLGRWHAQGRMIRFYLTHTKGLDKIFESCVSEKAEPHIILQGGNVLNTIWSIGLKHFKSSTFFAVGNDLSFPIRSSVEKQRETYYADGDYSSNEATGRDEARTERKWMGFTLKDKILYDSSGMNMGYDVELDYVGTTYTLWVYKTWLEANVLGNLAKRGYHYFNCTEGGIAGVMVKDDKDVELKKNWYMLDKICPLWHTMKLGDAADYFVQARSMM